MHALDGRTEVLPRGDGVEDVAEEGLGCPMKAGAMRRARREKRGGVRLRE